MHVVPQGGRALHAVAFSPPSSHNGGRNWLDGACTCANSSFSPIYVIHSHFIGSGTSCAYWMCLPLKAGMVGEVFEGQCMPLVPPSPRPRVAVGSK
jgi:hypothetical protein